MDPLKLEIRRADPTAPELSGLFEAHLKLMHASSPACSVHAKPAADLAGDDVVFLVVLDAERPVAMGALKSHGQGLGELKSMHVIEDYRGRGVARMCLAALLDEARRAGLRRVSLETESQPVFEAARALYADAGFTPCPPFADYTDDPNSFYMTLDLGAVPA